jgi:hypothetical protein
MSNYKRKDDFGREVGAPNEFVRQGSAGVAGSDAARALDDIVLANDFRQQAAKMEAEARGLLAESARLQKEAATMSGAVPETSSTTAKSKRGRPSNASKAVADAAN